MSKYAVTDGSFVWSKSSKREAQKFAKKMSKGMTVHVVEPKKGGMKVIETYYMEKLKTN